MMGMGLNRDTPIMASTGICCFASLDRWDDNIPPPMSPENYSVGVNFQEKDLHNKLLFHSLSQSFNLDGIKT